MIPSILKKYGIIPVIITKATGLSKWFAYNTADQFKYIVGVCSELALLKQT